MNWPKKGPELKKPKLKPPAFLADLYYDMRDRRLLLPIALVLVAIAAVPFLLGGSDPEVAPPPASVGVAAQPQPSASLAVVEATPGLRDYKKRLEGRTATDPFKQRHTGLPDSVKLESTTTSSGGGSSSSFEETVTVEDGSTTVEVDPGGSGGGDGSGGSDGSGGADPGGSGESGGGSGGGGSKDGLRLIEYRFTMQLSRTVQAEDGSRRWTEPEVRKGVKLLTQLPGKENVVATVGGVNFRNGKVYFLVADEVKSLGGEFNCVTRTPNNLCELLEVETGFPLELVAGANDVRHRIKVTKIEAVWAGKPDRSVTSPRAAFGPVPKSLLRP
jgi:hypothetical protein